MVCIAAMALFASGADPAWRLSLFLPLFLSLLCLMEATLKTCVVLAALGAWDVGCGLQRIPDRGLETIFRRRAKLLSLASLLVSSLFCALLYMI